MKCTRPLATTHPELLVVEGNGYCEYRVHNTYTARDGTGKTINQCSGWSWLDALVVASIAVLWPQAVRSNIAVSAMLLASIFFIHSRVSQVLHESVIVLAPHGLQLETHKGFGSTTFFTSRHFIPKSQLHEFVINEGLRGWNVRYYLAAIVRSDVEPFALRTAYKNILPRAPVLSEVYNGVQAGLRSATKT